MKKGFLVLLAAVLALSVYACAGYGDGTYTVEKNGVEYVVDTGEHTIFDGTYTYQYEFSGNRDKYQVDITYPDGSAYWWSADSYGGFGGGSGDNMNGYADGGVLCEILAEKGPGGAADLSRILAAVFIMAIGAVGIFSPYTAWYLGYGWRFQNAEPSDAAMMFGRAGGVIAAVLGLFMLFR